MIVLTVCVRGWDMRIGVGEGHSLFYQVSQRVWCNPGGNTVNS